MVRHLFFTILVFMLCLAQPDGDEHIRSELIDRLLSWCVLVLRLHTLAVNGAVNRN